MAISVGLPGGFPTAGPAGTPAEEEEKDVHVPLPEEKIINIFIREGVWAARNMGWPKAAFSSELAGEQCPNCGVELVEEVGQTFGGWYRATSCIEAREGCRFGPGENPVAIDGAGYNDKPAKTPEEIAKEDEEAEVIDIYI